MAYSIVIENGAGKTTPVIPAATYDISIAATTGKVFSYDTNLYNAPDAENAITEQEVKNSDTEFNFYVKALGVAKVRLVDTSGNPITDKPDLDAVTARRTATVNATTYFVGSAISITSGVGNVTAVPYHVTAGDPATLDGPDVNITLNVTELDGAGYRLVNANNATVTHKIAGTELASATTFDFMVISNEKATNVSEYGAALYDMTKGTATGDYLGIDYGTFTYTEK